MLTAGAQRRRPKLRVFFAGISSAAQRGGKNTNIKKEGEAVVELDQFKSILATYTEPLVEVRDSL